MIIEYLKLIIDWKDKDVYKNIVMNLCIDSFIDLYTLKHTN